MLVYSLKPLILFYLPFQVPHYHLWRICTNYFFILTEIFFRSQPSSDHLALLGYHCRLWISIPYLNTMTQYFLMNFWPSHFFSKWLNYPEYSCLNVFMIWTILLVFSHFKLFDEFQMPFVLTMSHGQLHTTQLLVRIQDLGWYLYSN